MALSYSLPLDPSSFMVPTRQAQGKSIEFTTILQSMKVLIATEKPFAPAAVQEIREELENAGHTVMLLEKYTSRQALLDAVQEANAMIVRSDIVDEEVLAAAPNLKIIVRAGAGYDNIDLAAATAHHVVVMNTPGQNANAVAELALGMMVFAVRGMFGGTAGTELKGKRLGLHAFGNVARNVARIAQGFGMEVYAYDPFCEDAVMLSEHVTPVHDIEALYSQCQVISLHIPATEQTRHSINYELLHHMPAPALLVNTARKEVIDEDGLIRVMQERADFRYVTDVMPSAFMKMQELFSERYFATPKKMGAQTAEANRNAGVAATKQIIAFFTSGDTRFQVNK